MTLQTSCHSFKDMSSVQIRKCPRQPNSLYVHAVRHLPPRITSSDPDPGYVDLAAATKARPLLVTLQNLAANSERPAWERPEVPGLAQSEHH
jgi:hypothetical protein